MKKNVVQLDQQLLAAFDKGFEFSRSLGPAPSDIHAARERAVVSRVHWNKGGPTMLAVERRVVKGPARDVPVVIYRPRDGSTLSPVFVFLHGGGFKIGDEWSNDLQMREIAAAWGGVIISVDYLHAPEHVFPAAVEETAHVFQWLHDEGQAWALDAQRISFGGTSAGASVAFGAAVELGCPPWLQAAVGIVGAFEFDTSSASMQEFGNAGLFPELGLIRPMFDDYVQDPAKRMDPRAVLTLADANMFPTTFLAAAEYDVFRDASTRMAANLKRAGRLHSYIVYPGMSHLFFGFSRDVGCSAKCVADVARFLATQMPT